MSPPWSCRRAGPSSSTPCHSGRNGKTNQRRRSEACATRTAASPDHQTLVPSQPLQGCDGGGTNSDGRYELTRASDPVPVSRISHIHERLVYTKTHDPYQRPIDTTHYFSLSPLLTVNIICTSHSLSHTDPFLHLHRYIDIHSLFFRFHIRLRLRPFLSITLSICIYIRMQRRPLASHSFTKPESHFTAPFTIYPKHGT